MVSYLKPLFIMLHCLGFTGSTLQEADTFAHHNLLRTGERMNITLSNSSMYQTIKDNEPTLRRQLEQLTILNTWMPLQHQYCYLLMMGGSFSDMKLRYTFLKKLREQGYTFDTYILLSGHRFLRDEEKDLLPCGITTEAEMVEYLWNNMFKEQPYILINVPFMQDHKGLYKRPTTDDTLYAFARDYAHTPGSCLVISENPFLSRQCLATQRILTPYGFTPIDGAGPALQKEDDDIILLMDESARIIYELNCSTKS